MADPLRVAAKHLLWGQCAIAQSRPSAVGHDQPIPAVVSCGRKARAGLCLRNLIVPRDSQPFEGRAQQTTSPSIILVLHVRGLVLSRESEMEEACIMLKRAADIMQGA